jgi:RNA polymerase primary sigma factor
MPEKKLTNLEKAETFLLEKGKADGSLEQNFVLEKSDEYRLGENDYEALTDFLSKHGIPLVDTVLQSIEKVKPGDVKSTDPIRLYLTQMGQFPLLSKDEEIAVAKKIKEGQQAASELATLKAQEPNLVSQAEKGSRKAQKSLEEVKHREADLAEVIANGIEAKDALINANLRLVVSCAKYYANNRSIPLADIIQEGNIGLAHAAEKFDYERGNKFSTYATWWIRQAISRALADQSRNIRIPVHVVEALNKINKKRAELTQQLHRDPTDEEVAAVLPEFTAEEIGKYATLPLDTVSLNQTVGKDSDDGGEIEDFIATPADEASDPTGGIDQEDDHRMIAEALDRLTPREKDIITLLFGLDGGEDQSLEQVGAKYGLSRERIRQIRDAALAKMHRSIEK